jgi:hypothetical protein
MSNNSYVYRPTPPRAWSRAQNPCTYTVDGSYNTIYIPLTNTTTSLAYADYQEKLLYKGNILQYKNNSSRITKKQKYSLISKGFWCNRKKSYATQSETYTNPNTTSLKRVNYRNIPFPNDIVGEPNNISGPYEYNVQNPDNCPTKVIQDGGNLVCNAYVNPCTNEVIKTGFNQKCFSNTCSDVPGALIDLCWDPRVSTWFPKQRTYVSNSGSKWPQGYKGFVSAVRPIPPVLSLFSSTSNSITLSWTFVNNICLPISSFQIYQNNKLVKIVPYTVTTTNINGLIIGNNYTFFITSLSTTIESLPSNIITLSNSD